MTRVFFQVVVGLCLITVTVILAGYNTSIQNDFNGNVDELLVYVQQLEEKQREMITDFEAKQREMRSDFESKLNNLGSPLSSSSSSSSSLPLENLPTCQELMEQEDSAVVDGSFLTRLSTTVHWKVRKDNSRELTLPNTCRLKRYTADEAHQCLKEKHLLFVGDSLVRYQYLSLAYFLENKKWPARFGKKPKCTHKDEDGKIFCGREPNVCQEGDWKSWEHFVQNVGGGTDGGQYNGRMEFQGVRDAQNMQYISTDGTKLSYKDEKGWIGSEYLTPGFNFTGCARTGTCRYTEAEYERKQKLYEEKKFDYNYPNVVDAFGPNGTLFHEQYKDPNYVFYGRGQWGQIQKRKAEAMMKLLFQYIGGKENRGKNRCFFQSTTGSPRVTRYKPQTEFEHETVRRVAFDEGCDYLDLNHLTQDFADLFFSHPAKPGSYEREYVFWDAVHYVPWVYEELNNMLLNVLCNAHDKYTFRGG